MKHGSGFRAQRGFSIMEATVASGVVGMMFATLLSGLTSSVTNVQFGREQNRATQIMVEKLDTIRMYRWDKVNESYVPKTFAEYYSPNVRPGEQTDPSSQGITYAGTISIQEPAMGESYKNNLKQVTVTLRWQSGGRSIQRQMTTFVSRYGLQSYIP